MANVSMLCHPATPASKAGGVDVTYRFEPGGRLDLRFHVDCEPGSLILPAYLANGPRADGLWQTTCFELFVRHPDQRGYFEFNFSPSTQWAAYRFSGYREGMAEWPMQRPDIHCTSSDMGAILEAALALPSLLNASCEIGLSAVLHETDETKSYWALAHPSGNPDFHHPDCFALNLAAPARS